MRAISLISSVLVTILVSCLSQQDVGSDQHATTSIDQLPTLRSVSAFIGTDQDSMPFNASKMKGKVWIASFFFTSCGTVCPALNTVLADLQRDYSAKVSFVSLTSDPDYDTPSVMKEYGARYGARQGTWWFVTMPKDSMMTVASRDLGLTEPASPDIHSTRFVLIDKDMHVRGFYDSADTAAVARLRAVLEKI